MARRKISDLRRSELIDATILTIAERGFPDTTLATIAAQAGVSPALVNHYFEGKVQLLEATLRRLTRDLADNIARLTPADPTPEERLRAIIDGCLTAEHFRPGAMLAWLSFWVHIPTTPSLAGLQRTINRRFRSNMKFALKQIVPEPHAEEIYLGIYALIDGFWIRQLIEPGAVDLSTARRICRSYLSMAILCHADPELWPLAEKART